MFLFYHAQVFEAVGGGVAMCLCNLTESSPRSRWKIYRMKGKAYGILWDYTEWGAFLFSHPKQK